MLIEVDRFVEVGDGWYGKTPAERTRADLVMRKVTINTEHIAWMQRYEWAEFDFTEVHTVDRGPCITVDIAYDDLKALMKVKEAA